MKIIFFGTPYYVLPVLNLIHKKFVTGPGKSPIVAVVTQSPKPTGRKQIVTYSPIDKWAHDHKIPIYYHAADLIKANPEADLGILASYGEIIPQEVINLFPKGILVIHPSLLPKYRGASPVTEAVKNGDEKAGVTIFKMDAKIDHGPIISQFKEDVFPTDTTQTLRDRLFDRSSEVLVELIDPYLAGKITPRVQNDSEATLTKILTKADGFIDLTRAKPNDAERFIRAMTPWPGAWTYINLQRGNFVESKSANDKSDIKRLKILKVHLENEKLVLDEVQLEGKEPVNWKQFQEGYKDAAFKGA